MSKKEELGQSRSGPSELKIYPSKTLPRQILLLVVLAGFLLLSLVLFFNFILKRQTQKSLAPLIIKTAPPSKSATVSYGLPVRLKIPAISVNAAIVPMNVTSSGEMEAPSVPQDVGWYRPGPQPGTNGNAVIDGHYGRWKNGEGSVFDNLNKLKVGDTLSVADEKGTTITFVVRGARKFDPKADSSDIFKSKDNSAHLNLITCEGVWDEVSKSYSKRLVVFTDKK